MIYEILITFFSNIVFTRKHNRNSVVCLKYSIALKYRISIVFQGICSGTFQISVLFTNFNKSGSTYFSSAKTPRIRLT